MKKVLVTGGNKGIGKAICQKLLEEYQDVYVILGSRDAARGDQAVEDLLEIIPSAKNRLQMLPLDVSCDKSVQQAAANVDGTLYGIINNSAVGVDVLEQTLNVNYFGIMRVNKAFLPKLQRPGGRIVNVSSGAAPMFVSKLLMSSEDDSTGNQKEWAMRLSQPWTIGGGTEELETMVRKNPPPMQDTYDSYSFSKAVVNAYTWILAKENDPDHLIMNSVTPGFIETDMTIAAGMNATNPPSMGAIPPVWLLMSEELTLVPTGRYYGSDCKRSPLHEYRSPSAPAYEGPDGK
jgi:NAD(P)-dependent dehydrogenase (short-subunit alcohol dehydrogenase family)